MRSLSVTMCIILSGCSSDPDTFRSADNKILCELNTSTAYKVEQNPGDTSVVMRIKDYDNLCNQRNMK